jgi:1,4-alpha-glucan branching enzyme
MDNQKAMADSIKEALSAMEVSATQLLWMGEEFNKACQENPFKALCKANRLLAQAQLNAQQAADRLNFAYDASNNCKREYISFQMESEEIHDSNTP